MDWLEREIVMEEQLERGREEQREREEQTRREEQRRGEERIKRDERRKREREWKAQQEREKRLGRKRERRQEMRGVEWERRRVGVVAKKGPGMIMTREEIREEVSVKPSIKQVLTDCKTSHFSGMSNKSLGASFQVTLK